ncbi:MAG: anti-virulence regulator CigR family protein [Pantoea sp.]
MLKQTKSNLLVAALCLILSSPSVFANPGHGNGNGNGNGNGHANNSGNSKKGHNDSGYSAGKKGKNPHNADTEISFSFARGLAVDMGMTGYKSLPPGIAKNLARGKPLPPGIAKRYVPKSMLNRLPYYPGYEWRIVGDDLVLIALSTAVVTAIINGVFD